MKKILSLLGFCVLAFHGFGQVKKIEKRSYGLLDSVYYVNGGDTVCIESFHKNGFIKKRHWKQDSFEIYNNQGKLMSRTQSHIEHDLGNEFANLKASFHQRKSYYPSGQLLEYEYWQGDTLFNITSYEPNGKIIKSEVWFKHKSYNGKYNEFYFLFQTDKYKISAYKEDTLLNISIDSTFYKGQLEKVTIENTYRNEVIEYWYYRENGKIEYHWAIDSNRLHPDKDNGDCLYGFRNLKGNWVKSPQYDNVKLFNSRYFIVNKNEKYGIVDDFGKIILPLDYDFLGNNTPDKDNNSFFNTDSNKPDENYTLKYRLGEKYGIIDFKGKVLLPPQYDDVRKIEDDIFEVKIGQKWGLVDSKGRIIVQPKYYKINFTDLPNIFEVIDTLMINEEGFSRRIEEIKGLINDKGETILNIRFQELKQDILNPLIFEVKPFHKKANDNINYSFDGIFDLRKGWILDTTYE